MHEKKIVGLVEPVKIIGEKEIDVLAKFDTGAQRTSIDKKLFDELGLEKIGKVKTVNVHGKSIRSLTEFEIVIKGEKFMVEANVADRSKVKFKVLIGRNTIFNNFVVDITKSHNSAKIGDLNESLRNRGKN